MRCSNPAALKNRIAPDKRSLVIQVDDDRPALLVHYSVGRKELESRGPRANGKITLLAVEKGAAPHEHEDVFSALSMRVITALFHASALSSTLWANGET